MKDKYIQCAICNVEIKQRNFKKHLLTHNISEKDYFDQYMTDEKSNGICPTCGNKTKFHGIWAGYSKHCNTSCSAADPAVVAKKNATMINTYGFVSSFSDPTTQQHIKESSYKKYGVSNPAKSKQVIDKMKQTCRERYGVDSTFQSDEIKTKIAKTNLERYGVDNPFKSYELMKNTHTYECRLKAYRTKKANGNISSLETFLENELKQHNINYKSQYNLDERYPWHCDFYLPDTDVFVEINGFWTHGGHWFDENNTDDIKILNKWIEQLKHHTMYEAAIRQWTQSDVLKRQTAKQNKLNYVVLWNMQDIQDWTDSGFETRQDY